MYSQSEKSAILEAEALMVAAMARYDPSHDAYHVQRVRKTAVFIARSLDNEPDLLVIEMAALLHDVLDKKYVSAEDAADPHAYFAPFFRNVIDKHGLDLVVDGRARFIVDIVSNVSWTTEKRLRAEHAWSTWHDTCIELHCVQDADRLDAIGAFGILRCAAFSSAVNRPLHALPGDPAVQETAVQHFHDKLLHIKDRLKTIPGKRMGERRHQVMLDFLSALDQESCD